MELCENKDFDMATARKVLEQIDPSKEFEHSPRWKGTTYNPRGAIHGDFCLSIEICLQIGINEIKR